MSTDPDQAKRAVEELRNKAARIIQRKFKEHKAVKPITERKPLEVSARDLATMALSEDKDEVVRHEPTVSSVIVKVPHSESPILDVSKVAGLENKIRKLHAELDEGEFEHEITKSFISAAINGNRASLGIIDRSSGFTGEKRELLAIRAFEEAASRGNFKCATYLHGMVPEPFKSLMQHCVEGKEGALDSFKRLAKERDIEAETLTDDSMSVSSHGSSRASLSARGVEGLLSRTSSSFDKIHTSTIPVSRGKDGKGRVP